jgi:hypothetical protein
MFFFFFFSSSLGNVFHRNFTKSAIQAYVIYAFAMLIFRYVALNYEDSRSATGAIVLSDEEMVRRVKLILNNKPASRHLFPLCMMRPWPTSGKCEFFDRCRRGVTQYVIWRIAASLLVFALHMSGWYEEGNFSPNNGYLYVSLIFWTSQGW